MNKLRALAYLGLASFLAAPSLAQAADSLFARYHDCFAKAQEKAVVSLRQIGTPGATYNSAFTDNQLVIPGVRNIPTIGGDEDRQGVYVLSREGRDYFLPFPKEGQKGADFKPAGENPRTVEYSIALPRELSQAEHSGTKKEFGLETSLHMVFSGSVDANGKFTLAGADIYTYPKYTHTNKKAFDKAIDLQMGSKAKPKTASTDETKESARFNEQSEHVRLDKDDMPAQNAFVNELQARLDYLPSHHDLFADLTSKATLANLKKIASEHPNSAASIAYADALDLSMAKSQGRDPYKVHPDFTMTNYTDILAACRGIAKEPSLSRDPQSRDSQLALARSLAKISNLPGQGAANAAASESAEGAAPAGTPAPGAGIPATNAY